jgi:hypothetical protein
MKLVNMEVSGFKLYEEVHFFSFGMANQILGDRGKGKTALCEAIVWCLKGCDLQGGTRGLRKRLKNWVTKEIRVVTRWDFLQPDGSLVRHQFSRVSKGRSTHLYLDDKEVEQSDFDVWIGPTDTFLSVFSPGYLGSVAAVKQRSVILSLLQRQDHVTVMDSLTEDDRNRLMNFDLNDPLKCMQELKDELQEWNEYNLDLDRRMSTIRMVEAINGGPDHVLNEDLQLEALKCELETLSQTEGPEIPEFILDLEKELITLGHRYREHVANWKEINKKPLPHVNLQVEKRARQVELDEISTQCQLVLNQGFTLKERIASERKHYEEDLTDFLTRKDVEMQQLLINIRRLEAKQALRRSNEKRAEGLPRMQNQIKEGVEERDQVWAKIQSVQNFMLRYADMQVEVANRALSFAKILLTTKRETDGNVTLQYKLLYDKKEYFTLTSSEKIRCSFELSNLVSQVQGRMIPVFVDNGESIDAFKAERTQFFVTSVIPYAALTYEVVVA